MGEMRDIPGFPGYSATRDGRIYSAPNAKNKVGRFLRPCILPTGYYKVALRRSGETYGRTVHRLVCEAFHGPCPEGMECCHANGDRMDNRPSNLRWDTRKANHADALRHGTHPGLLRRSGPKGESNASAKFSENDIRIMRYLYDVAGFSTGDIAWQFDVTYKTIWKIVTRRGWKHICQDQFPTN